MVIPFAQKNPQKSNQIKFPSSPYRAKYLTKSKQRFEAISNKSLSWLKFHQAIFFFIINHVNAIAFLK